MPIWLIPLFIVLFVLGSLYLQKPLHQTINRAGQNKIQMSLSKCNKCIVFIFVILIVFMLLLYVGQNYILYIPVIPGSPRSPSQNNVPYRHPTQQYLNCIDIQLETSDGVKIRGWHVLHQNSKRIVVFFHENAGNIGHRIPYIKEISKRTQSDVILIAYRGYSDSQSYPSENGIEEDSYSILNYAFKYSDQKHQKPVYILGRSLGGAVGINAAFQPIYINKIRGIIIENTFTSIQAMVDSKFKILSPFKFLLVNFWPSIMRVPKIKAPMLFIMSMNDQIVPVSQMQQLIQVSKKTNSKVMIYKIEKGTHNFSWRVDPQKYFQTLSQYFLKCQK